MSSNSKTGNNDWIARQPYQVNGTVPNIPWSPGHLKGDGKSDPSFGGTAAGLTLGWVNRVVGSSSLQRLDKLILTRNSKRKSGRSTSANNLPKSAEPIRDCGRHHFPLGTKVRWENRSTIEG